MKQVDELFKTKLKNYESEVPAEMWHKIAPALEEDNRSRYLYLFLLLGLLVSVSVGSYFAWSSSTVSETIAAKVDLSTLPSTDIATKDVSISAISIDPRINPVAQPLTESSIVYDAQEEKPNQDFKLVITSSSVTKVKKKSVTSSLKLSKRLRENIKIVPMLPRVDAKVKKMAITQHRA